MKYYVVIKGKKPGIYIDYDKALEQIKGYPFSYMRSFKSKIKADEFFDNKNEFLKQLEKQNGAEKQAAEKKKKYYVVVRNPIEEIFDSTQLEKAIETARNVKGTLKKFKTYEDAEAFIASEQNKINNNYDIPSDRLGIYVDGSYAANVCSYACVILNKNGPEFLSGCVKDEENLQNVTGELTAARKAIEYCINNDIKEVDIYYDFFGIEQYCLEGKTMKQDFVNKYIEFMTEAKKEIDICFHKVKSHSKNRYNDMADMLAKNAIILFAK